MSRYTDIEDRFDESLTERCRQCGETVAVRADEPRPDGPFVCDRCVRETINRAARSPLSNFLFDSLAEAAGMRRIS